MDMNGDNQTGDANRLPPMRKYGDRIPNSILRQAQDERRVGDSVATSEAGCGAYTLTIQREELEN